jgi:hypothetical protein
VKVLKITNAPTTTPMAAKPSSEGEESRGSPDRLADLFRGLRRSEHFVTRAELTRQTVLELRDRHAGARVARRSRRASRASNASCAVSKVEGGERDGTEVEAVAEAEETHDLELAPARRAGPLRGHPPRAVLRRGAGVHRNLAAPAALDSRRRRRARTGRRSPTTPRTWEDHRPRCSRRRRRRTGRTRRRTPRACHTFTARVVERRLRYPLRITLPERARSGLSDRRRSTSARRPSQTHP